MYSSAQYRDSCCTVKCVALLTAHFTHCVEYRTCLKYTCPHENTWHHTASRRHEPYADVCIVIHMELCRAVHTTVDSCAKSRHKSDLFKMLSQFLWAAASRTIQCKHRNTHTVVHFHLDVCVSMPLRYCTLCEMGFGSEILMRVCV